MRSLASFSGIDLRSLIEINYLTHRHWQCILKQDTHEL